MRTILRLLDANANRAREATRVMEDVARFVLDDRELAAELKDIRHGIREGLDLAGVSAERLLDARDAGADVGATISTPSEQVRTDTRSIVLAASKRLSEALRSLEEGAKTLDSAAGVHFERLRYRAYAAEPRLLAALPEPCPQWRVMVLITSDLCSRPWTEVALAAVKGGADALQLREKSLGDRELLERARTLVELAGDRADVIVNDRPDIAALAGARGVHLGQDDLSVRDARAIAPGLLVGVSCSTLEHARQAAADGADCLGLGPMFPSETKPKPALAGPELVRSVVQDSATAALPHVAISGINPASAHELLDAGCRGVAVSGVVCGAADPARAVADLRAAFGWDATTTLPA